MGICKAFEGCMKNRRLQALRKARDERKKNQQEEQQEEQKVDEENEGGINEPEF